MPDSRSWARLFLLTPALALSLASAACGPSMRTLVESDMRFEHCYRIDDDPKTPLDSKRGCWSQWTAHYAKGQDRARVTYAKQRLHVLDGVMATTPPPVASPVACPSPSSPYAPPPAVAPKTGGEVATAAPAPACAEACTKAWRTCTTPCGSTMTCVNECDDRFRSCVKACL